MRVEGSTENSEGHGLPATAKSPRWGVLFAVLNGVLVVGYPVAVYVGLTRFSARGVGLLHALVAMDMPGPGTVFLSQNWQFIAPVFIGDTITAEAEVLSLHTTKPVTQLKVRVKRQTGETVLEGEAWCYTFVPEA